MIQKSEPSDRRILTFPVVHPCESISPTTLLRALITLSSEICSQSRMIFASQKRNAREAIRQTRNLLIFFEEIRDRSALLPDSIVLCFSELYLTFQKLRYLLEDCSREGARLWILMKYERISTEFRILIRTVATALDVLPLPAIKVSTEVIELIELVKNQAHKAKFEADPDDERAAKDVLSILREFEGGIVPDVIKLRCILDHLEIRNWSDCNNEVKFLDEEISLEIQNGDEKVITFLTSLMSFMNYCRCVLFDSVDNRGNDRSEVKCDNEVIRFLNADDFRCPISLELMTDPVIIATGQTYDRSSILKWLKAGSLICPKTGEKLKNTDLVPNSILRKLIRQFCSNNGIPIPESGTRNRDITRTIFAGSRASAEAMRLLAEFLAGKLTNGRDKEKNKAASEIRILAKSSIFNRSCLTEAGTIPYLLNLLSSKNSSIQENSIAALLNLSKHSKSKTDIVVNGGLRSIIDVVKNGIKMEARQIAAATLFYLSSIEEYRKLIGEIPDAIPALVELIKEGSTRGKKNAIVAIFGLLQFPENHERVLEAGTVPLLIDLLRLSLEKQDLVTDSLAVLATISEKPDGAISILCISSTLSLIMGILHSSTSRTTKEYCVSLLLSLCINGGQEVVAIINKSPLLIESLYSVISERNSRMSKKASSLLRILDEFHNSSSSHLISPAEEQERFIRVR